MNRNRITALLLSLALLLTCLCPLGLAESTEDPVLATVNGRQVLKSEVDSYVDMIIAYYSNYGYDLSDEESQGIVLQYVAQPVCCCQREKQEHDTPNHDKQQCHNDGREDFAHPLGCRHSYILPLQVKIFPELLE